MENNENIKLKRDYRYEDNPNRDLWMGSQRINNAEKQIFKIEGNSRFIEFLSTAYGVERIKVVLTKYDKEKEKGNRVQSALEFYIEFKDALIMCEDILNKTISRNLATETKLKAADSKYYQKPAFVLQGGVSAEKLMERKKAREDGKPMFRKFSITCSSNRNAACAFLLEQGPGKTSPTSGIIADYAGLGALKGKDDGYDFIAVLPGDIKGLALVLKAHIEGYIASQYALTAMQQEMNYLTNEVTRMQEEMKTINDENRQYFKAIHKAIKNSASTSEIKTEQKKETPPTPPVDVDDETVPF